MIDNVVVILAAENSSGRVDIAIYMHHMNVN